MNTCRCLKSPIYYPFEVGKIYLYDDKEPGTFILYNLNGKHLENFISPEYNGELYFIDIQIERDQKLNEILN